MAAQPVVLKALAKITYDLNFSNRKPENAQELFEEFLIGFPAWISRIEIRSGTTTAFPRRNVIARTLRLWPTICQHTKGPTGILAVCKADLCASRSEAQ